VLHLNWQGDQPLLQEQERLPDSDRLSLWNMLTGQQIWAAEQPLGYSVTWSPDGDRLALWPGRDAIESSTLVMDAATGNTLFTLEATGPVAWSPDGRYLAIVAEDRRLSIYDAQSGDELFSIALVESPVRALSWSRDGRYLTLAHEDDSFFIWQVAP
jgi:WD40 repeat protein